MKLSNLIIEIIKKKWKNILNANSNIIDRPTLKADYSIFTEKDAEKVLFALNSQFIHLGKDVNTHPQYSHFFKNRPFKFHEGFVACINKAIIHGETGITTDQNDRIVLETGLNKRYYVDRTGDAKFFLLRKFKKLRHLKGNHILMSGSVSSNYFMWVCYFLPQIKLLNLALGSLAKEVTIILGAYHKSFQLHSLKALGFDKFYVLDGQSILLEKLVIPSFQYIDIENSPIGHINILSKRSTEWLNDLFKTDQTAYKNILISRSKTTTRRIINEVQLIDEFPNFKVIYLEELSFLEQVQLFNQTKFVISPHGAGLTNLIFGRKITVFEFYPDTRPMTNPKNLQICEYLEHQYHLLILKSVNDEQDMNVDEASIAHIKREINNQSLNHA